MQPPHNISRIQTSARSLSQLLNKRPNLSHITQIHARIITQPLTTKHIYLTDSLIHCYLHIKKLNLAKTVFDYYPLPPPPTLIWNLMIRAYSKLRHSSQPINLFHQMINSRVLPDDYTFTFVITSCAYQKTVTYGHIAHGMSIKCGFRSSVCVGSSLINLYAVFFRVEDAHKVFDEMPVRDVCSWTSLVSVYAKNGDMSKAIEVFKEMPVRNGVSWAVMISGFVGCGMYNEALTYFRKMLGGVAPNEAVIVCALSACAHLGSLDQGKWIHEYMKKNCIVETSFIKTALIDMYAKCGKIDCAYDSFCNISRRDICTFTSMIYGFSIHGLGERAIHVFDQMLAENLKPNAITILGILNGCSHSGLVNQGSLIFYNMENLWGIAPKIEHYGCYIDLLGRAGYLAKAFGILKKMPVNPDVVVWRALLSSCRVHRNVSFGERVISHLEKLHFHNFGGATVLLAKLYASLGKWEKVAAVRAKMVEQKIQSDVGCSWIEINGVIHEFRVADSFHPQIVEIRAKLCEILEKVRLVGYAADSTQVSFDIGEEDKLEAVTWHSEKLAVAFGLMQTGRGVSIRIVKNLRTCEDCHNVLKAVSKIFGREIIVRDRSRFHSFNEGKCSCKDYW